MMRFDETAWPPEWQMLERLQERIGSLEDQVSGLRHEIEAARRLGRINGLKQALEIIKDAPRYDEEEALEAKIKDLERTPL